MTHSLCIVGEAWGRDEDLVKHPFVGAAGLELYKMLLEAGFALSPLPDHYPTKFEMIRLWKESGILLFNVFNERPPDNKIEYFFDTKKGDVCDLPMFRPGLYLKTEYKHYIDELHAALAECGRNLILALGNTACWAIFSTPNPKIGKLRGAISDTPFGKVLPMFHPANILRNWENRTPTISDMLKAKRECLRPEFITRSREVWVEPDIPDLYRWWDEYGQHSTLLSIDIETEKRTQISEVGIASDATHALHIPFIIDKVSYWPDVKTEMAAWKFVRMVCESPIPKLGQNFLYDIQYLWKVCGIPVHNFKHDTMLLHHALFPGMQKDLGFLGSIYCNEPAWKGLRRQGNKDDE